MGSNDTPIIILDIETLNAIAARLLERAETIHQITLVELVLDLRLAARACELLAHVRFALGDIAANTTDETTRRALNILRDDATVAAPQPGQP